MGCCILSFFNFHLFLASLFVQSADAVEYTNFVSVEGEDHPPNECPRYDTKQSHSEVPETQEL